MDRYARDLTFRFGRFALAGIVILTQIYLAVPALFVQSAYAGEQPGFTGSSQNLYIPVSGSPWLGVQAAVKVDEQAQKEASNDAGYELKILKLGTAVNDVVTAQYAPTSDTAYYDLGGIKQRQAELLSSASDCLDRSVYVFGIAQELNLNPAIIILHDPLKNSGHSVVEIDDGNGGRMIIDATTPEQPASLSAYTDQGYRVATSVDSLEALTEAIKSINGEYSVADLFGSLGSLVAGAGNTINNILSSPSPSPAPLNSAVSSSPAVSSGPAVSSVPSVSSGSVVSSGPAVSSGSREISILSQFMDTVIGEKTGAMKHSLLGRVDTSTEKYHISEDKNGTPIIVDASGNPQVVDPLGASVYSAAAKVWHIATGDPRAAAFSASMAEQGMANKLAQLADDLGTNPDGTRNWAGTALAIPVQAARSLFAFAEFPITAVDTVVTAQREGWDRGMARGGLAEAWIEGNIESSKAILGLGLGLVSFPTDVFVSGPINFLSSVTGGDGKILQSNWLAEGVANAPFIKDLGLGDYVGQVDPTKAEYPNIDFTLGNAYFFLKGRISAKKGTPETVSPEGTKTEGVAPDGYNAGKINPSGAPESLGKNGALPAAMAETKAPRITLNNVEELSQVINENMNPGGIIVLDACSTGAPGRDINILQKFQQSLRPDIKVFGSRYPSGQRLVFNEEGYAVDAVHNFDTTRKYIHREPYTGSVVTSGQPGKHAVVVFTEADRTAGYFTDGHLRETISRDLVEHGYTGSATRVGSVPDAKAYITKAAQRDGKMDVLIIGGHANQGTVVLGK